MKNSHKKGDGPGYAAFTGTAGPASSLTVSTIPWTHIKINGSQGNLKKRNKFVTDGARFCCYCILFTKDSQSVHSFFIENKTYGICRETGKLIPAERLRAVPHATLSIEAKNSGKK